MRLNFHQRAYRDNYLWFKKFEAVKMDGKIKDKPSILNDFSPTPLATTLCVPLIVYHFPL